MTSPEFVCLMSNNAGIAAADDIMNDP